MKLIVAIMFSLNCSTYNDTELASFHHVYMLNLNWTIVQLWAARNEGSSLLDSMTKAIDEVCIQ